MRPKHIAPLLLLLAGPSGVRADGCKFASDGRTVPEREQRALVEWADGTETLYVADVHELLLDVRATSRAGPVSVAG